MCAEPNRTHLFVLRLWREATQPPETDWRGSVTYAVTGETRHFSDRAGLYGAIERITDHNLSGADISPT